MVECERVPGEAAVRPKRCRDALEAAATIGPRGQMQQRPPRAVDQGRWLLDFKLPYVSFTQVELDSLLNCAHSSLREHRRRRVNPYYTPARCLSNRDRNAPGANCKLDQWPVGLTGKLDVERDVSGDASRPLRVSVRPSVVPVRHGQDQSTSKRSTVVGWASVPQCTLTTDPCAGPQKVSDTESPVSVMSAISGVRHQLGRMRECAGIHPDRDLGVARLGWRTRARVQRSLAIDAAGTGQRDSGESFANRRP